MTLIVSALANDFVVQASDRRLTMPDRRVVTDKTVKQVCVSCSNANFSVAYTGLARLGPRLLLRTDHWLVDVLQTRVSGDLDHVISGVREAANVAFSTSSLPFGVDNRLTIALAGFVNGVPFSISVTNQENAKGESLPNAQASFTVNGIIRKQSRLKKLAIVVHGCERTVAIGTSAHALVRKVRRGLMNARPSDVCRGLVKIIRKASDTPVFGRHVGKDCLATVVQPGSGGESFDFPEKGGRLITMPHVVVPSMSFRDVRVLTGPASREEFLAEIHRDA